MTAAAKEASDIKLDLTFSISQVETLTACFDNTTKGQSMGLGPNQNTGNILVAWPPTPSPA